MDKETVTELKKQNGNQKFTEKDFLLYIAHKMEKFEEALIPRYVILGGFSFLLGLIGSGFLLILKLHGIW